MAAKMTAVDWLESQLNTWQAIADDETNLTLDTVRKLLEQAKAMEKEQIKNAYRTGDYDVIDNPDREADSAVLAPTFSQAFRWFRKKYNLYHKIDKQGYWFFEIKKDEGFGDLTEVIVSYDYNSYEEAELACLDKLIEIVNNL